MQHYLGQHYQTCPDCGGRGVTHGGLLVVTGRLPECERCGGHGRVLRPEVERAVAEGLMRDVRDRDKGGK